MAFYQVKLKRNEDFKYEIYRADSIEDVIDQFRQRERRSKESLKERYKPTGIEDIKLFWDKANPLEMIDVEIPEVFLEISHLGQIGYVMANDNFDWLELRTLVGTIANKIERAYALLDAYYDFTQNNKSLLKESVEEKK